MKCVRASSVVNESQPKSLPKERWDSETLIEISSNFRKRIAVAVDWYCEKKWERDVERTFSLKVLAGWSLGDAADKARIQHSESSVSVRTNL